MLRHVSTGEATSGRLKHDDDHGGDIDDAGSEVMVERTVH